MISDIKLYITERNKGVCVNFEFKHVVYLPKTWDKTNMAELVQVFISFLFQLNNLKYSN